MTKPLKIIGICGSLRKASFNRMALEVTKKESPRSVEFEIVEIGNLPLFNEDLETHTPPSVSQFREKAKSADAILFATPEHNYSVSGSLKNAIEWGSRPKGAGAFANKPVAILGASNGMTGTARAQSHLRQICVQVNMYPLNQPELLIPFAQHKFDPQGNLLDEKTRQKIKELILALIEWTKRLQ